jgi:hypothetical protein
MRPKRPAGRGWWTGWKPILHLGRGGGKWGCGGTRPLTPVCVLRTGRRLGSPDCQSRLPARASRRLDPFGSRPCSGRNAQNPPRECRSPVTLRGNVTDSRIRSFRLAEGSRILFGQQPVVFDSRRRRVWRSRLRMRIMMTSQTLFPPNLAGRTCVRKAGPAESSPR